MTRIVTSEELAASLKSDVCPACGEIKKPRQSLCSRCFYSLDGPDRSALFKFFGAGYEEAMREAFRALGAATFHTARPK